VIDAYLARLGLEREPPSPGALRRLHQAHVERVPYETVWIHIGERHDVSPERSLARIAGSTRGGYCFHLNGALVTLLEWLQVDVTRHVSGVQGGEREAPGPNGNHLGVTVRLPDGSRWFVDAGLGDGPVEPFPLVFATYEQSGFTYELRPSSFDPDGWRLEHDPRGAFIGADFASAPARTEQFLAMHQELSTSPTSGFVRIADVMRRTDEGVDVLRGCVRMTTTGAGTESVDVDSEADWWGVVIDEFGLRYGDLPAAERARVWDMVRSAHEAWDAAGRS